MNKNCSQKIHFGCRIADPVPNVGLRMYWNDITNYCAILILVWIRTYQWCASNPLNGLPQFSHIIQPLEKESVTCLDVRTYFNRFHQCFYIHGMTFRSTLITLFVRTFLDTLLLACKFVVEKHIPCPIHVNAVSFVFSCFLLASHMQYWMRKSVRAMRIFINYSSISV